METILFSMDENGLTAYGLSAYIITRCILRLRLLKREDGNTGEIYYVALEDLDFLISNKNFRMMVSDDRIEIHILNQKLKERLPKWVSEFQEL